MKKVLVLGGGFAGLQTAISLQKKGGFDITLVSDRDYLYLYPISIWIPVHLKEFNDVKVPLAKIQKKYPFKVVIDKVAEIRASENTVVCENNALNWDSSRFSQSSSVILFNSGFKLKSVQLCGSAFRLYGHAS
jgi:sulfide:quinone oxidoreductase